MTTSNSLVSGLGATSPCRGAGSAAYVQGTDIDGELWASPPSIGCDEIYSGSAPGALSVDFLVAYTNVAAGFRLSALANVVGRGAARQCESRSGAAVMKPPYTAAALSA